MLGFRRHILGCVNGFSSTGFLSILQNGIDTPVNHRYTRGVVTNFAGDIGGQASILHCVLFLESTDKGQFMNRRLINSLSCLMVGIPVLFIAARTLTQNPFSGAAIANIRYEAPNALIHAQAIAYTHQSGPIPSTGHKDALPPSATRKTSAAKTGKALQTGAKLDPLAAYFNKISKQKGRREDSGLPKIVNGRLDEDEESGLTKDGRPKLDNPLKAYLWRRLSYLDENGQMPSDGFSRAYHQRQRMVDRTAARASGIQWIDRGPRNVAGRTRSLLIHPTQTNRMWAGSVGGGIWYSQDRGATWSAVNDFMKNLAICCMAMDPSNANTMYAGTGEGYFNGDAIRGGGLFKTIDGGATWSLLPGTGGWGAVNRVAVSPSDSNVILATVNPGGIYRSTNGGASWTLVQSAAYMGVSLAFNPKDGSKAIATIFTADNSAYFYKALYSTDAGQTWLAVTGGLERQLSFNRTELAYAPSDPSIVYADSGAEGGTIWKSTDGGMSYARKTTTSPNSSQLWYDNAMWVSPTDPNLVVLGGNHFYRSSDGGVTLNQISEGYILTDEPHPDSHFITADPGYDGVTNKRVYVTTDGGVHYTNDITTAAIGFGWGQLHSTNRTSQFYSADGDGKTGIIYGGLQDNGSQLLKPGSDDSSMVFGGDGGFCAVDSTDNNFLYGEYVYLAIHRSADGGASANWIFSGLTDAFSNANFIAPFILDPNNANRLLGGGASVWRTNNAKGITPIWTAIRPPSSDYISALAVAPGNSNVMWVGQNDGVIVRTGNALAANPIWATITSIRSPLPRRYVERITIDPANPKLVYVGFGGFSANNLWKTTDAGLTWTSITGTGDTGLPPAPVRGIARHPDDPNILYVGTEVGVFVTYDGGKNWSTNDFGPASVSVDELKFMADSKILLAATHGRGVFTADVTLQPNAKPTINPISPITGNELALMTFTATATDPDIGQKIRFSLGNAPSGATITRDGLFTWTPSEVQGPGNYNITVTATDNGSPAKSDSTVVSISVKEVNSAPVLSAIADQTVKVGSLRTVALNATDSDLPANILTFSLPSGPSWASISGTSLVLSPAASLASGNYTFKVRVTDNGVNPSNLLDEKTVNVKVTTAVLQSISFDPNPAANGRVITGTVKLDGVAPAGGMVVNLTTDNASVAPLPSSVLVAGGASVVTFTFTAGSPTAPTPVMVTAQLDTITQSATIVVAPAGLASITMNPNSVVGGNASQMTVSLTDPAPAGGTLVTISTDTPYVILPTTVRFLPGKKSVTLSVVTKRVTSVQVATITAQLGNQQVSATLTITVSAANNGVD